MAGPKRSFRNPFSSEGVSGMKGVALSRIEQALVEGLHSLRDVLSMAKQSLSSTGSVYAGVGGLAYMLWHLARHMNQGLEIKILVSVVHGLCGGTGCCQGHGFVSQSDLLEAANRLCDKSLDALKGQTRSRITFLEGYAGPLGLKCAILHDMGQRQEVSVAAEMLFSFARAAVAALPDAECELLYGRAGLLYALLFVEAVVGISAPTDIVQALIAHCHRHGKRTASRLGQDGSLPEMMYEWHGKAYLGAAHGVTGVVHVLAEAHRHVEGMSNESDIVHDLKAVTMQLAGLAQSSPHVNLPSSWGSQNCRLVHWCHGTPGLLLLLSHMHLQHGSAVPMDFKRHIPRLADLVWEQGLLHKGVGLCHGIAGNGYALLAAHRALGDDQSLGRALAFGVFAADVYQQLLMVPDRPASLFEGLAGAICFWADLLKPDRAHFPGFELPAALLQI